MEKLNLIKDNTTIISLNIISVYLSISFRAVERAAKHYSKKINRKLNRIIKHCLEMIKIGMVRTLIMFVDKYY